MKTTTLLKHGLAALAVLAALPAAGAAPGAFETPLMRAQLDPAAFAAWGGGRETAMAGAAQDVVWTRDSRPQWKGVDFGEGKTPGPRHLRIGFTQAVPVGSVLARGGGRVSVLKPDAPYPGDLGDDAQWLAAERLANGATGATEAGPEDYALWVLPRTVATRALRFSHTADPADATYAGRLGTAFVLGERWANVAPQAAVTPARNPQNAALLVNESNDRMWQTWDNWEEGAPRGPVSPEQPETITLVWPQPATLRGLNALWAGFAAATVRVFDGPADQHPLEAPASAWREAGRFEGIETLYPIPLGPNWMDFGRALTTRAVRVCVTKPSTGNHPHVVGKVHGGCRIWLGELLALQPLGDAPLATAAPPATETEAHPPIPVRFTLKEPGFVTLVVDDADGVRVRNLVSETPFPAGVNAAWWDGMDDLGRNPEAARHGVYHVPGRFVAPGAYRVRGLFHRDLALHYEFPVYTAGSPAWNTADHTGAWLANHSPPSAALFVPAARAPGGRPLVYLGSYVSEGTHGLAWVDPDGRKVGGVNWVGGTWTGAPFLTRDDGTNAVGDVFAYAGATWHVEKTNAELRLTALTKDGDRPVLRHVLPLSAPHAEGGVDEAEMGGLAARDGLLVVSLRRMNKLLFVDSRATNVLGRATLDDPRGLAFDSAGRLLALSGTRLLRSTAPWTPAAPPVFAPFIDTDPAGGGLEDPCQLALDDTGRIFISDRGRSHQVKVFSPDGRFVRAIGRAGEPRAGAYDPKHMNRPNGLTVDHLQRLWVAESDEQPKRVSVWSMDGQLLKAFYGPAEYGGGGALDPRDPSLFHYRGMTFRLDWKRGTDELVNVYQRLDRPGLPPGFRNSPPQTALYRKGRRYFTNCFNNNPTGGSGTTFLFVERDGIAVPVAGMGRAHEWTVLAGDAFRPLWPAKADPKGDQWRNPAFFAWSDLNGDAQAQPDEVQMTAGTGGGVTVMPDLAFVIARLEGRTMRFAPVKFTSREAPVYDLSSGEVVAEGVAGPKSSGGDQALVHPDGWSVVTLGVAPFSPYSLCGVFQGRARWSYPSPWPGLHASHEAPAPDRPGQVIGSTRLLGGFVTPRGGDAGPLWCVNGNFGPMYLFTADGLFVRTLFRDVRQGKPWSMPAVTRDMRIDELSPHDENFWPGITQTPDGRVYLVDGARTSLVRVDGLDTLRRLPDAALTVTETDLRRADEWRLATEAARQAERGRETLAVALRAAAPAVDGILDDWAGAAWATVDKRGVKAYFNSDSKPYDVAAAVAVSGDRLFAAFRTGEPKLLENSGGVPNAPFKTGGALDLMLGADPKADPQRTKPVAGDLRLLVTRVKGRPLAVLYRAVVPGMPAADRVPFSSPWRTIHFDRVDDVSAQVDFAAKDGQFEFSIPLAALGLRPEAGMIVQGDLGVLRGSAAETTQRVYWSNKATGITADVPSEAELTPHLWGRWRIDIGPVN